MVAIPEINGLDRKHSRHRSRVRPTHHAVLQEGRRHNRSKRKICKSHPGQAHRSARKRLLKATRQEPSETEFNKALAYRQGSLPVDYSTLNPSRGYYGYRYF